MSSYPLVSIIVITYNSAKYVIDTLESCKDQTYKNLELVITDDASVDNTLALCEKWIQNNCERFISTKIVSSETNTGIAPNINRGLTRCQGEWIKPIAGDDILGPEAVSSFINLAKSESELDIIHSEKKSFSGFLSSQHRIQVDVKITWEVNRAKMTAADQLKILSRYNFINAPTLFVRRSLYTKIGNYNERYPMIEDWPFIIKCLKNGVSLRYMNHITVYYRVHNESILRARSSNLVSRYQLDKARFIQDELLDSYGIFERFLSSFLTYSYFAAYKSPALFHRRGFQIFFNGFVYLQKLILKAARYKYFKMIKVAP